jgi:hypothetical protein
MTMRRTTAILLTAIAGLFSACGGGDGISGTGLAPGSLRVAITDAPACGYDAVNVTVQKVRVHQSATAADGDGGWSELVLNPARRIDLLGLTNGVVEELGETPLPAGRYTQLRLVLADNTAGAPLANAVKPTGGRETPLDTPSAQQSGLKLKVNLVVPSNKVLDLVLDFDACKSVVKAGNSGKFNLKPVIAVIPRLSDAGMRIVGFVDPAVAPETTEVSAQQGGVPVKATRPDGNGRFVLYPVPAGSYELVLQAAGRTTAVVTGVPVITTAYTYVGSAPAPIALPLLAGPPRTVTGTVNPATGTVRALQSLGGGGPTVEVAWGAVDALTGAFSFALAVDAPLRAPYAADPLALRFAADAAAAGQYLLEAAAANGATQRQPIDATQPVAPIAFVFP